MSTMAPSSESMRPTATSVAFLFVLAIALFHRVLMSGNEVVLSSTGTDIWHQFFYWRQFGFGLLARGEIPLWNPYSFSGAPFMAEVQTAVFYPLNVLYLVFDIPFAINLSVMLHCFLASLFTYLFARFLGLGESASILSAITFAYGAPYFLRILAGHLSILCTAIWLPLLFLGMEAFLRNRDFRYAVLSGLVLSLQVLAGHPQYVFYSLIAVSLYFALRLPTSGQTLRLPFYLAGYVIFIVTGVLVAAVQLLPTLELTKYSVREALSYEWASSFSLRPEQLITLLAPDFFGNLVEVPYWGKDYLWEASIYLGLVSITMVLIAFFYARTGSVCIFSLIASIALIVALGKHTPVFKFLYYYVPGFDLFRGVSKSAFIFSFCCSMIAGYGLDKLSRLVEERSILVTYLSRALFVFAISLVILSALGALYGHDFWKTAIVSYSTGEDRYTAPPLLTEKFLQASLSTALRSLLKAALFFAVLGGILVFFVKNRTTRAGVFETCVLALAVIDLSHTDSRYLTTFKTRDVYMEKELRDFIKQDKDSFRVSTPVLALANRGMIERIQNVGGFDTIVLKSYSEFINFAVGRPVGQPNTVVAIGAPSPLLNLLNVKYYILDKKIAAEPPGLIPAFRSPAYRVYLNKDVLPRTFLVHDAKIIKSTDAILTQLASPEFLPTSRAIVEEEIPGMPHLKNTWSPLPRIVLYSPNKVSIQADFREPGLLVLADAYYPGWHAFIDGKETKIYRTNYVLRGVFAPAGEHMVEFRYDPLSFKVGVIITLTSLSLVGGYLLPLAGQRGWGRARVCAEYIEIPKS